MFAFGHMLKNRTVRIWVFCVLWLSLKEGVVNFWSMNALTTCFLCLLKLVASRIGGEM